MPQLRERLPIGSEDISVLCYKEFFVLELIPDILAHEIKKFRGICILFVNTWLKDLENKTLLYGVSMHVLS